MEKNDLDYTNYPGNLNEELASDMENSELTAIAYATSKAKEVLGVMPEKVIVEVSGEILKNFNGSIVPNSNHLREIEVAIAAGIVAGKPERKLDVISEVTENEKKKIKEYIETYPIEVKQAETAFIFDIQVNLFYKELFTKVRIVNDNTNIILIEKNGNIIYIKEASLLKEEGFSDNNLLKAGENIDLVDIKDIIGKRN